MSLEKALTWLFGLGCLLALLGYIFAGDVVELIGWTLVLIGGGGEVVRWLIRRGD